MRPSHYNRFCKGSGIGHIDPKIRRDFLARYEPVINNQYEDSIETSLLEEVAMYDIPMDDGEDEASTEEPWHGIDIKTDARHGHRKNAKDCSVVALGDRTNKVLFHAHVTKQDDHVSQRHELIGTKRIYEHLKSKDVAVRIHAHDRNLSINKFVRENGESVVNQNDPWHAIKALKKSVTDISTSAKKRRGSTWHWQLEDKVQPLGTNAHWAIQNSDGNGQKLQDSMLNSVEHYKNNHTHCNGV